MKPMPGAAWNLQPESLPTEHEPGSERSDYFEPECNHPDFWPGTVMGFDYTGGAKVVPTMEQTPANPPSDTRRDDMRDQGSKRPVDYSPLPKYANPAYEDGMHDEIPSHAHRHEGMNSKS